MNSAVVQQEKVVSGEVPALPCYSQGESIEESNVREAIELYLEVLGDEGRDAPLDSEVVYQVSVAV